MSVQWMKRLAVALTIVLSADAAFAAPSEPRWVTNIDAGSAVHVTMKADGDFDAIWMGRDGDRAVFERFDPHETISVPLDSVRRVRTRGGQSSRNAPAIGALGAVAGVFGALIAIGLMLRGT